MSQTRIKCPNCGQDIKVDELFELRAEEKFRAEYENRLTEQIASLNKKKEEAAAEVLKLKRLKEEEEDIIRKKLEKEKEKLSSDAFFKAKKEVEFEMLKLKQENEIKSKENLSLKKKEVEISNKERELREKSEQLDIDIEKKMIEKEKEIREKALIAEREKNEIRKKEYEKQLDIHRSEIDNMKKKESEMLQKQNELRDYAEYIKTEAERQIREKLKETEEKAMLHEKEAVEKKSGEYEKLLEDKSIEYKKFLDEKSREYEKIIEEKSLQINEMKRIETELRIKTAALIEQSENLKAENESQLLQSAKEVEEKAIKSEQEKNENEKRELVKQIEKQNSLIQELKARESELKKNEIDLKNRSEQLQLDSQSQFQEKAREIEEKAIRMEHEKNELKFREFEKQLDDQKKLIDELKHKSELRSQQLQGEIQEIVLEEFLHSSFPFDVINEVKKGEKGADAIHLIKNNLQQECGKIIYESKRTKAFSELWIEKLKEDQLHHRADIAVIVTETMPKDMDKFGLRNGVWVCSFQEIKSLSFVLREMLIRSHSVKAVQENKGEKMDMLYSYLTSNEFVKQIESIVEGFTGMLGDLQKEKNAMERIWSTREKLIRKILINTSSMYGSIKGISGDAIAGLKALELPESSDGDSLS